MCDKTDLIGLPCDCELANSQPSPETAQRENITKSLTAPLKKGVVYPERTRLTPQLKQELDESYRHDLLQEEARLKHEADMTNPHQPHAQPLPYPRRITTQTTRTEEEMPYHSGSGMGYQEGGPANPAPPFPTGAQSNTYGTCQTQTQPGAVYDQTTPSPQQEA